jgi:hypothetical protein
MKIYFAYRDGYRSNHRHLRAFEAASVRDWFVQNWPKLCDEDAVEDFLGAYPYGFPINDLDGSEVAAPRTLKELRHKLEHHVYCEKVLTSKHCVQVLTDDDEIDLAWYVFDEEYAAANADKLSLWFHPELPTEYSAEPYRGDFNSHKIPLGTTESGAQEVSTYFMATTIGGGGHLSDGQPGAAHIEGVAVPGLLDFLRRSDAIGASDDAPDGAYEVRIVQQLCKLFPDADQEQVFTELAEAGASQLGDGGDEGSSPLTLTQVREAQARGRGGNPENPDAPRVCSSEHLIEVCAYYGNHFDYLVIFDSYWLNAHRDLASSLAHFCSTWRI